MTHSRVCAHAAGDCWSFGQLPHHSHTRVDGKLQRCKELQPGIIEDNMTKVTLDKT